MEVRFQEHDDLIPRILSRDDDQFFYDMIDCVKDELKEYGDLYMLHDSNGLFLFSTHQTDGKSVDYLVYNSSTKDHIKLEQLLGGQSKFHWIRMRLLYNPSKSSHYKVVCIAQLENSAGGYQIQLYSSEKSTWQISKDLSFCPEFSTLNKSQVLDGILCWPPPIPSLYGEHVLSLDFDSNRMTSLSAPPFQDLNEPWVYFGESGGHLYIAEARSEEDDYFHYLVWEMKDIRDCVSSWKLKFQFRLKGNSNIAYIHIKSEDELQIYFTKSLSIWCLKSSNMNTISNQLECIGNGEGKEELPKPFFSF